MLSRKRSGGNGKKIDAYKRIQELGILVRPSQPPFAPRPAMLLGLQSSSRSVVALLSQATRRPLQLLPPLLHWLRPLPLERTKATARPHSDRFKYLIRRGFSKLECTGASSLSASTTTTNLQGCLKGCRSSARARFGVHPALGPLSLLRCRTQLSSVDCPSLLRCQTQLPSIAASTTDATTSSPFVHESFFRLRRSCLLRPACVDGN